MRIIANRRAQCECNCIGFGYYSCALSGHSWPQRTTNKCLLFDVEIAFTHTENKTNRSQYGREVSWQTWFCDWFCDANQPVDRPWPWLERNSSRNVDMRARAYDSLCVCDQLNELRATICGWKSRSLIEVLMREFFFLLRSYEQGRQYHVLFDVITTK